MRIAIVIVYLALYASVLWYFCPGFISDIRTAMREFIG